MNSIELIACLSAIFFGGFCLGLMKDEERIEKLKSAADKWETLYTSSVIENFELRAKVQDLRFHIIENKPLLSRLLMIKAGADLLVMFAKTRIHWIHSVHAKECERVIEDCGKIFNAQI